MCPLTSLQYYPFFPIIKSIINKYYENPIFSRICHIIWYLSIL